MYFIIPVDTRLSDFRLVSVTLCVWTFTPKRKAFQTMAREIKQRVASQPQANSALGFRV